MIKETVTAYLINLLDNFLKEAFESHAEDENFINYAS
jgi:hypothetical protein